MEALNQELTTDDILELLREAEFQPPKPHPQNDDYDEET